MTVWFHSKEDTQEMKTYVLKRWPVQMFTACYSKRTKRQKQSKCPSTGEQVRNVRCVCTMEWFSKKPKKWSLIQAGNVDELRKHPVTLKKQTQETTYWMMLFTQRASLMAPQQ